MYSFAFFSIVKVIYRFEVGIYDQKQMNFQYNVYLLKIWFWYMRLRHKKPLNSYVGQANLESSQVLDEDFEKNAFTGRKPKLPKMRPTSDNSHRYASILCQFIQTINVDYKNHLEKFGDKSKTQGAKIRKESVSEVNKVKKIIMEQPLPKNIQVVSKQQLKYNVQQKNKQVSKDKEIKKLKAPKQEFNKGKQSKDLLHANKPQTKQPPPPKKLQRQQIDLTQQDNLNQAQKNIAPPGYNPINPLMFQNGLMNINNINPALFQSLQYQMPMYQNILAEQMKQNPNMMMYAQPYQLQNLLNMFNFQNMPNNYIPFSKLPFCQSKTPQKIPDPPKPKQKAQAEVKSKEKILDKSISQGFFNKRSCTHLAIAYHIHCQNLKAVGKLNKNNNQKDSSNKNFHQLDPTYPAKKIRARKSSEILVSTPPNLNNHLLK